jgi:hypothetical protein
MGLLTAYLTGCGGGGEAVTVAAVSMQQLSVKVASTAPGDAWRICLDADQNLACDASDPVAEPLSDGNYRLALPIAAPLDARHWVAERRLSDGKLGLRLAAPAQSTVINGLTTFVSAQMLAAPSAGLAAAQQEVARLLGLPDDSQLLSGMAQAGAIDALDSAAVSALQAGTQARAARAESIRAAEGPQADTSTSPQLIPQTALNVMARYVDMDNGGLLATVTPRTISGETAELLNPTQCRIEPPLRIRIDTEGGAPIVSKDDYVTATLRTEASEAYGAALELQAQIRGRGNSTWGLPKKPYRLKLARANSLLGMTSDRDWALLANYADKSMLRNAVAFCLSKTLGLSFTPSFRFVELELNGEYQGLYQLVEHIKTAPHRVDIGDVGPLGDDPGGFLVEIDARLDADHWFVMSPSGTPFTVKSDTDAAHAQLIYKLIQQFEDALFGDNYEVRGQGGYLPLLDAEAFVDFYLLNELLKNNDAFFSSTFITRKNNGQLVFGPAWDFDLAAGNAVYNGNESPTGWWVRRFGAETYNAYAVRLFTDPSIEHHAAIRWAFLSRRMSAIQSFIRTSAATLDNAQKRNFETWDILNVLVWPNPVASGSYAGEIDYLTSWLQTRTSWMDQELDVPNASR